MRMRRLATVLALFGVLLHVGIAARHNAMARAADSTEATLASALSVICTRDGAVKHADASSGMLPDSGDAPAGKRGCPDCVAASSVAVLHTAGDLNLIAYRKSARLSLIAIITAHRMAAERPPPRGPPATV